MNSEEMYLVQTDIDTTMRRLQNYRRTLEGRFGSQVERVRGRINFALDALEEAKHQTGEIYQLISIEEDMDGTVSAITFNDPSYQGA